MLPKSAGLFDLSGRRDLNPRPLDPSQVRACSPPAWADAATRLRCPCPPSCHGAAQPARHRSSSRSAGSSAESGVRYSTVSDSSAHDSMQITSICAAADPSGLDHAARRRLQRDVRVTLMVEEARCMSESAPELTAELVRASLPGQACCP